MEFKSAKEWAIEYKLIINEFLIKSMDEMTSKYIIKNQIPVLCGNWNQKNLNLIYGYFVYVLSIIHNEKKYYKSRYDRCLKRIKEGDTYGI